MATACSSPQIEGDSLIRLTRSRDIYDQSAKFRLADFVDLPGQGGDELDLEGLISRMGTCGPSVRTARFANGCACLESGLVNDDVADLSPCQVTSTFEPGATTSPGAGD